MKKVPNQANSIGILSFWDEKETAALFSQGHFCYILIIDNESYQSRINLWQPKHLN